MIVIHCVDLKLCSTRLKLLPWYADGGTDLLISISTTVYCKILLVCLCYQLIGYNVMEFVLSFDFEVVKALHYNCNALVCWTECSVVQSTCGTIGRVVCCSIP